MLHKDLFKTMFIVNFSKDSKNPFRSALLRVCAAASLSALCGYLFTKTLAKTSFPTDVPEYVLLTIAAAVSYFLSGFIMMSVFSSQSILTKNSTFVNALQLMPLKKLERWLVTIAPGLIIVVIIDIMSGILLHSLSQKINIEFHKIFTVWTLGLVSGYGYALFKRLNNVLKIVLFLCINMGCYYLFDLTLKADKNSTRNIYLTCMNLLYVIPLFSFVYLYKFSQASQQKIYSSAEKQIIPTFLPSSFWFLVKIWRNRRTRSTIVQSFTIVMLVSSFILLKKKVISDPYSVLLLSGTIAAMVASEVRGIMRRYLPPEIILLRGTKGIVSTEVATLLSLNMALSLPLLFAVHGQADKPLNFALFYVVIQIFSSLAGLLASTIFVPANNEVGSQFFTVILATSSLYAIPKIAHFSDISSAQQIPYWLIASVIATGSIYITEVIRRSNYGRS